jgi:protein-S-isoprenylcysteine O-methyltransferase Ste14
MADTLRFGFLAGYAVALVVLVVRVLPLAARIPGSAQRATGARRWLPAVLLPVAFLVPPAIMLARVGELDRTWPVVRLAGVALGLYAAVMMLRAAATLGRQLVPQAVVFPDHTLATSGPYALVRHPAYSGDLALWLGAALATLDVVLLALWPLYLVATTAEARVEEQLLEARFGPAYADYAQRTGRFVPRLIGRLTARRVAS